MTAMLLPYAIAKPMLQDKRKVIDCAERKIGMRLPISSGRVTPGDEPSVKLYGR